MRATSIATSIATATKTTPLSARWRAIASSAGSSSRQGLHHVAQKCRITGRPRRAARLNSLPEASRSRKSGAASSSRCIGTDPRLSSSSAGTGSAASHRATSSRIRETRDAVGEQAGCGSEKPIIFLKLCLVQIMVHGILPGSFEYPAATGQDTGCRASGKSYARPVCYRIAVELLRVVATSGGLIPSVKNFRPQILPSTVGVIRYLPVTS